MHAWEHIETEGLLVTAGDYSSPWQTLLPPLFSHTMQKRWPAALLCLSILINISVNSFIIEFLLD